MKLKRVVITGMGALTPIGNNLQDYWNALLAGTGGAAPITHFDTSKFKTQFACEIKNFDINQFMDRKEARKHDLYSQYGIVASDEAIADAGLLSAPGLDKDRVGVIWASGIGGLMSLFTEVSEFATGDGTPRFGPFFIPRMIADIAAGHISIKNGFRGPNFATVSACASSANALADAYTYIRLGKADAFVCGGSEAAVSIPAVAGFNAMHALSTRNDDPATASRPFDKDRDGFVLGEGAGALILEEYEHAKARGAKIYAEVVGAGLTADAHHMTAPDPDGTSVARAMRLAVEESGCRLEDVDHINTHGTSTPVGDVAEVTGILKTFGEHAAKININSTKSCTGHLLGAAGAIEAIATTMAVKNDIVPPTINHFTDDPAIDPKLNFTFGKAQKRTVNLALSNTFGFGGHNVSIAIRKYVD
ncbi:beta-ketoacyl-ACP synthase II [bacterium]|nr:beta-ketoacyl-ACP synthase II [bacterium]